MLNKAPPPSSHMPRALIRALATNCLLQNHASIWSPANDLLQLAGCASLPASMNAHPQSTGDLRKAKSAPRTTPLITHRPRAWSWLLCSLLMQTLSGSALGDESKIRGDGHPSYQSLSLKEAWRRVEDNNPDYIAAQAKVRDAEGDLIVAGQRPNPALSLGTAWYRAPDGSGGASLMDRLQKYTDYNVGISISVERGSKRELREGEAAKGF